MRTYEQHVGRHGHPPNHQKMKELLAGFAAAEVDKLFETHGLNWLDREKAKHLAIQQAHRVGVCSLVCREIYFLWYLVVLTNTNHFVVVYQLADEQYGAGNFMPTGYFQQQPSQVY